MTKDQITVSRELLRQALDALASAYVSSAVIASLRTALEQPDEVKPIASIYISADGEREFDDWKVPLPTGRTELFTAPQSQPAPVQEPISWGVDWGSHGDRSCVSIVKKHANGALEVVATEYGPVGSAPQAQPHATLVSKGNKPFNYCIGYISRSGAIGTYMTYSSDVFHGNLEDAEGQLRYVQTKSPDKDWKIYVLTALVEE